MIHLMPRPTMPAPLLPDSVPIATEALQKIMRTSFDKNAVETARTTLALLGVCACAEARK